MSRDFVSHGDFASPTEMRLLCSPARRAIHLLVCCAAMVAGAAAQWERISPLLQGNHLRGVACNAERCVAFGDGGAILLTDDGVAAQGTDDRQSKPTTSRRLLFFDRRECPNPDNIFAKKDRSVSGTVRAAVGPGIDGFQTGFMLDRVASAKRVSWSSSWLQGPRARGGSAC